MRHLSFNELNQTYSCSDEICLTLDVQWQCPRITSIVVFCMSDFALSQISRSILFETDYRQNVNNAQIGNHNHANI